MTKSTPLRTLERPQERAAVITRSAKLEATRPFDNSSRAAGRQRVERFSERLPQPDAPPPKDVRAAMAVLVILAALSLHHLIRFVLHRMAGDGALSIQQHTVLAVLYPVAVITALYALR